jgi:Ca-activated chloride channel family protein
VTFGAPLWLLAIPVALPGAALLARAHARRRAELPGELGQVGGESGRDATAWRRRAETFGGLLIFAGLALPRVDAWDGARDGAPPRPAVCVVDVSRSMLAEDEAPSRFARARQILAHALVPMAGRRVGLVTFAGSAEEVAPPTTDLAALRALVDEIDPRRVLDPGSAAAAGLAKALERLKPTGGDLFLFSDGEWEDEGAAELALASAAVAAKVAIHVVPLGRETPIALVAHDADGATTPLVDSEGRPAVSRADRARLVALARAANGRVVEGDVGDASFDFAAPARAGAPAAGGLGIASLLLVAALLLLTLAHGMRERIA